jgi:hypothetical protein
VIKVLSVITIPAYNLLPVLPEGSAALHLRTTKLEGNSMSWTKPEAEVVAVTMEVTAYVATL